MQIQLLGGVRVVDDVGDEVDPGPAKCRELLGALALSLDRSVPVPTLIDLLWGEEPPRTAAKTLQTYVARLRRALGHQVLVRDGGAYRLELPDEAIDVRRFRARLRAGDVRAALVEWSGMPLAGLDAEGLRPMVDGLVEEWFTAIETELTDTVEADPSAALGRLTELTASHPFREGLWALLMTALYRVGRQSDALDAYRRARAHLVEELGVEPGSRLRELETAILEHDPRLGVASPRAALAVDAIPTGTVAFATAELDRTAATVSAGRHVDVAHAAAEGHGGVVISTMGASVSAAFHRVSDAIAWAQTIRDIDASGTQIGVHLDEAEMHRGVYLGVGVEIAARLAAAAHGGQVLLSGAAAALAPGAELTDLGAARLDDASTEVRVHQLGNEPFPPLRVAKARRAAPPRPLGRLIGRHAALSAALEALAHSRVLTLVGPGGIGKTRLAVELAQRQDLTPSWFVELAGTPSSTEVARTVADALAVSESQGRSLTEAIIATVDQPDGLLVLDNCEHVIDGAADLVAAVVGASSSVTVLCTSREGLGIAGEQLVVVGPLDAGTAGVELFVERASAIDRSFDAESERVSVEAICRRLDGVPLAIELAAARVRSHAPSDLAEQLDGSFRLLAGGRRATVERHRTLQATVQWSYDLLDEAEAMVFRRLAVFAGPFDLVGAEAVVPDGRIDADEVGAVLADLVDRSMISVESVRGGRRYRMLETIRQFGAERLGESNETDAVAERHADHVYGEVLRLAEMLAGPDEVRGAVELAELWPNLRTAIDWALDHGDVTRVERLLRPLAIQSFLRRGVGEISDWAQRLIDITGPNDGDAITTALMCLSLHNIMTQDVARFRDVASRRPRPDDVLAEFSVCIVDDDPEHVLDLIPAARAAALEHDDRGLAWLLEIFTAGYLLQCGRLDEASEQIDAAIVDLRAGAPPTYLNWALYIAGAIADIRGDHERSEALYRSAVELRIPPRTNSPNESLTARWAFEAGDHLEAFETLRAYVDELIAVENRNGVGLVSLEFVNMAAGLGRLDLAAQVVGHLRRFGALRDPDSGFAGFVADAVALVDADDELATIARAAAEKAQDPRDALHIIAAALDELIDDFRSA
jgi:predicted ATPase/DNA-binding SARP family transcriptional activator